MATVAPIGSRNHDPLRLREMLLRAASLASEHALPSTVIGLAGREGDLLLPEILDFVESQLRVDDSIFRMTRERAVLVLADVDRRPDEVIVGRLIEGFQERFGPSHDPQIQLGYFEVGPQTENVSVKGILPTLFSG